MRERAGEASGGEYLKEDLKGRRFGRRNQREKIVEIFPRAGGERETPDYLKFSSFLLARSPARFSIRIPFTFLRIASARRYRRKKDEK